MPASATNSRTTARLRSTNPTSRSEMPSEFMGVPPVARPNTIQTTNPTIPGSAKIVKAICQSIISDNGVAVATDRAIPRLKNAVVRAFITVTSLGRNHCINSGPVPVSKKANPTPIADRSNNNMMKLGANPERETRAIAAQPIMKERRKPMRAIRMPLGRPKAAATSKGIATSSPAVARLMS